MQGAWNDLLAAGSLFWLPLLLAAALPLAGRVRGFLLWTGLLLTAFTMQLFLTVSSLDVPFFQHFFARISDMVLSWRDQPQFLLRMVAQESRFWWFIGAFLLLSFVIWYWALRRIPSLMRSALPREGQRPATSISMVVLLLLLSLILRSKLVRRNFFTHKEVQKTFHPLLDKISQNPLLTLAFSLSEKPFRTMLEERISRSEALSRVSALLNIKAQPESTESVARTVSPPQNPVRGMNVVLVLMESVNRERQLSGLMPRLNEIAARGLCWSRFYSAGVHTYAGIYATLCSFPVQMRRHAMKWDSAQSYCGLASLLRDRGYRTLFYLTHDESFDNMGPFLRMNGFSRIVGLDQFDRRLAVSTFGVPDHVLYDRVLAELDDHGGKSPFLAVVLSGSNHAPFRLPGDIPFAPKSQDMPSKMTEYSDWALGRFMAGAAQTDWAGRTLFVFIGDHGASGDYRFLLPHSMVHVPMIMVGPTIPAGEEKQGLGSQLDVMPTIMGRLGFSYRNSGFGVDLFVQKSSLAVFCSDDYLGCTDGEYYLSFNFDGKASLGRIDGLSLAPGKADEKNRIQKMKADELSIWRIADWFVAEKRPCAVALR